MWQETDIQKAAKAAAKGKEVRVAVPDGDDGYRLIPFERYFQDCRFLIGVPAVRNPEFEEAMHPLEHVAEKLGHVQLDTTKQCYAAISKATVRQAHDKYVGG